MDDYFMLLIHATVVLELMLIYSILFHDAHVKCWLQVFKHIYQTHQHETPIISITIRQL